MSLKVYKNEASKSYENEFFPVFKHQVEQLFEQKKWDGILIAFAKTENEKFKPDIILANRNRIFIIDFKKIGGVISFPEKRPDFEQKAWYANGKDIFAHRDFANPYKQVKWHRNKFTEITGISQGNISIGVLFHGQNAELKNEMPDSYSGWTSVMTRSNFIKEIEYHLDVDGNFGYKFNPISLLNHTFADNYVEVEVDDYIPEKYHDLEQENEKLNKKVQEEQDKAAALNNQIKHLNKEKQGIISKNEKLSEVNKKEIEEKNRAISQLADEKRSLEKQIEKDQIEWGKKNMKIEEARAKAIEEREKRKKESEKTKQAVEKTKQIHAKLEMKNLEMAEKQRQEDKEKAEAEAKTKAKAKAKETLTKASVAVVVLSSAFLLWRYRCESNTLEESRQNGTSCIPYEEVEKYENENGVCVTYYVNDVYKDKYGHIYLNKEKLTNKDVSNGEKSKFTTFIGSESVLSEEYAKSMYQYKTIEVHGNIERYKDELQIQVFDKNQIKVKE